MDNKNVFANNLQRLMDAHNKSRRDICEALGFNYYTFTDWVTGRKYPRMNNVEILANYFGVKKSDLIEEKTPEQIEVEKKAGSIAEAVLKMKTDPEFLSLVEKLVDMDSDQIRSVDHLIVALLK